MSTETIYVSEKPLYSALDEPSGSCWMWDYSTGGVQAQLVQYSLHL